MKRPVIVLFISEYRTAPEQNRVGFTGPGGEMNYVYIRVQSSRGDVLNALDKAKPRPGEIVLNAVDFEQQ